MKFIYNLQQTNKSYLLLLIILIYILLSVIMNLFIITEELYYRTFSEQLSYNQIDKFLNLQEKWSWIGYIFIPISIAIKLSLVAIVLKIGVIFSNLKISFKQLFHITIFAESVFVLSMLTKIIWLFFNSDGVDLEYIQYFYPLSAINLVDYKAIAAWSIYAIQILNLFELLYWFLLAFLLKDLLKRSFWNSFEFVISTYALGLLFWVVLVVFISLNFS